jgi:hypothetical protein
MLAIALVISLVPAVSNLFHTYYSTGRASIV